MSNESKTQEHGCSCCHCAAGSAGAAAAVGVHNSANESAVSRADIIKIAAGAVFFAAALFLDKLTDADKYWTLAVYIISYIVLGGEIVLRALKNLVKGNVFDENFLMSLATAGAFLIGEYSEAAGVMLFYQIGELFQGMAVKKSKKAIAGLMDMRPDYINLKKDGEITRVSPETAVTGDIIVIKPGEKVPLDGIVIEGNSMLDTAALTGESVPRSVSVSDTVLSGCINKNGVLTVRVTKVFSESTASKVIELVENAASKKAPAEQFITVFSRYYTPAVTILAAFIAFLPPVLGFGAFSDWINRGLIFLVISCPCALVISIPLGFFGGIGAASKKGVLVKGGNYLEALSNTEIAVFDKTGTLTRGVFKVTAVEPSNSCSNEQLLEYAAYAETFSNHPAALSIKKAYGKEPDSSKLSDYNEIAGQGISVNFNGRKIILGSKKLMESNNINFQESKVCGTKVYAALDGVYLGVITIADEIKPESKAAVAALRERGVQKIIMLTGDNEETAALVGKELELDGWFSGLLPADKIEKLEALERQKTAKGKIIFTGDGINDAPALARADVGAAIGALGSDAAIEAADVVLMAGDPSKLADAIDIACFTKKVVLQNIVFALSIKFLFLALGAAGIATMWEAVFADVGVAMLAVLNAARTIAVSGYSRGSKSQKSKMSVN